MFNLDSFLIIDAKSGTCFNADSAIILDTTALDEKETELLENGCDIDFVDLAVNRGVYIHDVINPQMLG